ncbi:hypothetical protein [Morganella morganii]|uniref:hypothetical protein n=1 Tax=Morganella morganii TaxID=582 RepID=UPI0032DB78DC
MFNCEMKIDADLYKMIESDLNSFVDTLSSWFEDNYSNASVCEMLGIEYSELSLQDKLILSSEIESAEISGEMVLAIVHGGGRTAIKIDDSNLSFLAKSSAIHEMLGFEKLAKQMRMKYANLIMELTLKDIRAKAIEEKIISKVNKTKASKPRNPYYSEVMSVIKCTWEKYPCASKTGLIDALFFHYRGKVSRNTLLNWVNKSGFQPGKPKKYSSFELVFPQ